MRVFCTLTKADEVDTGLKHNIAGIVYSRQIHNLREAVKQGTGIPIDQVSYHIQLRNDVCYCCSGIAIKVAELLFLPQQDSVRIAASF